MKLSWWGANTISQQGLILFISVKRVSLPGINEVNDEAIFRVDPSFLSDGLMMKQFLYQESE